MNADGRTHWTDSPTQQARRVSIIPRYFSCLTLRIAWLYTLLG